MKNFLKWLESHESSVDLKQEMMQFLSKYKNLVEEWKYSAEIAIYYFAEHYHGGQWSELYKILSTSHYRPGPMTNLDKEDEVVKMMYEDLEKMFGNRVK